MFERISAFAKQIKSSIQQGLQERREIKAMKAQDKEDMQEARMNERDTNKQSYEEKMEQIRREYEERMEAAKKEYEAKEEEIEERYNGAKDNSVEKSESIRTENAKGQAEGFRESIRNMDNYASVDPVPSQNSTEENTQGRNSRTMRAQEEDVEI